jgi:hypothetical protein
MGKVRLGRDDPLLIKFEPALVPSQKKTSPGRGDPLWAKSVWVVTTHHQKHQFDSQPRVSSEGASLGRDDPLLIKFERPLVPSKKNKPGSWRSTMSKVRLGRDDPLLMNLEGILFLRRTKTILGRDDPLLIKFERALVPSKKNKPGSWRSTMSKVRLGRDDPLLIKFEPALVPSQKKTSPGRGDPLWAKSVWVVTTHHQKHQFDSQPRVSSEGASLGRDDPLLRNLEGVLVLRRTKTSLGRDDPPKLIVHL